jgi:hypothetical protein
MKNESNEALQAYKIRIDALEIINEAYRTKIEALEMLTQNLQFLREVKNQVHRNGTSSSIGSPGTITGKRGRGRPRKYPIGQTPASTVSSSLAPGEKRGRGRPRKYPIGASPAAATSSTAAPGEKRGRGRPRKYPVATTASVSTSAAPGEKRGRGRPRKTEAASSAGRDVKKKVRSGSSSITRLQFPLETWLRDTYAEEGFNKATFRALTGILLCLFENGTATVSTLNEYIGGSRVTIVRHTGFLKKAELITYEGSRKKGHYALTAKGRALYDRVANA